MTSLDVATISIMVALALSMFGGMITVLVSLRTITADMGDLRVEVRDELRAVRLEMRDLRDETREVLRRFGERLTRHEQSGH